MGAGEGRRTSRGGEGTHLGGLQASSTGGEELPGVGSRWRTRGGRIVLSKTNFAG